ncbi:hypothetical protein DFH07DRAFT_814060 [Mycena maculata]|uniref:Uncharacterized protein n=1 Tax=Mycena maculata TaxID=230809 RepID=A0AAD7JD25_9AGAR|nr:hypothetical protein DFH07DRAFT_814060 [Mycena maculata]
MHVLLRLDFLGFSVRLRIVVLWSDFLDSALLGRGGKGCLGGRLLDVDVFVVVFVALLILFFLLFSGRVGVCQQERGQTRLGLVKYKHKRPTRDRTAILPAGLPLRPRRPRRPRPRSSPRSRRYPPPLRHHRVQRGLAPPCCRGRARNLLAGQPLACGQ